MPGHLWFHPGVSQRDFTDVGLWLLALLAVAFFGYLIIDGLRHRLKWRRLVKKGQESRDAEPPSSSQLPVR